MAIIYTLVILGYDTPKCLRTTSTLRFKIKTTLTGILLYFPLSSLHVSLSAQGQTMVSALVFSTLLWLSLILALRFCLKLLLSYHRWMFEQHGRVSNVTKVWVVRHASTRYHSSLCWSLCRGCFGLCTKLNWILCIGSCETWYLM